MTDDRLFVPLNAEPFEKFEDGSKTWEVRGYDDRFNRQTVTIGRDVELRYGYAGRPLWGVIDARAIARSIEAIGSKIGPGRFGYGSLPAFCRSARDLLGEHDKYIAFRVPIDVEYGFTDISEVYVDRDRSSVGFAPVFDPGDRVAIGTGVYCSKITHGGRS